MARKWAITPHPNGIGWPVSGRPSASLGSGETFLFMGDTVEGLVLSEDEVSLRAEAPTDPVAVARTAAEAREAGMLADISRQDWVDHLRNDTLAELETYVRGALNVDSVTDLASAKQAMKRTETALVKVAQVLALLTVR